MKNAVDRSLLVVIAFNFVIMLANAQERSIDSVGSIYAKVQKLRDDTLKIRALIRLGDQIMKRPGESRQQIDSGMVFFDKALRLAKQLRRQDSEIQVLRAAGTNLFENRDSIGGAARFDLAAIYYEHAGSAKEKAGFWLAYGHILLENTNNTRKSLLLFSKADSLYRKLNMPQQALNAEGRMACLYARSEDIDKALDLFSKIIRDAQNIGYRKYLSSYQKDLAGLYWKKGNVQQTLYYYLEALKSAEENKNEEDAFVANTNLASLYFNLKMYDKALGFIQGAYRYQWKNREATNFHATILSIVHIRIKLHQTKGLVDFIQKGERRLPPTLESRQASIFQAYGLAYDAAGNVNQAERSFLRSMELFGAAQQKHQYGPVLDVFTRAFNRTIGDFYLRHRKFQQARPYFQTVLRLPKTVITPNTEIEVRSALFRIDSAAGNYVSAIRHLQIKMQLHDSLFNASSTNQVAELNAKYETGQRMKDIKLLQSQRDAQKLSNQKVTLQRNVTFGGIAALLIIAALLFAGFRNKQKANRRLELQQARINQQNHSLQELLSEKEVLLSDKETLLTEKDWLLKEVHHRVKNNLQIIMSLLNSQSVATDDPTALEALKISRDRVQAISLIHQKLSNDNNMATVNIRAYVSELVDYLSDGFDTAKKKISFKLSIVPLDIDIAQAVSIALILNEAITNSIKYAFDRTGGEISLRLEPEADNHVVLTISDNGKGLGPGQDLLNIQSLGFNIMKGLTAQLRGNFTLGGNPGTLITVTFRLKKPKQMKVT